MIALYNLTGRETGRETGSESIEAIMRSKRTLFAVFVACIKDTRLSKCAMLGELVEGAVCVGSQEKEVVVRFVDDCRALRISAEQI